MGLTNVLGHRLLHAQRCYPGLVRLTRSHDFTFGFSLQIGLVLKRYDMSELSQSGPVSLKGPFSTCPPDVLRLFLLLYRPGPLPSAITSFTSPELARPSPHLHLVSSSAPPNTYLATCFGLLLECLSRTVGCGLTSLLNPVSYHLFSCSSAITARYTNSAQWREIVWPTKEPHYNSSYYNYLQPTLMIKH